MLVQSTVRKGLVALVIAFPLWAGCGADTEQTGPAVEPNRGPEMAAGAGKVEKGGAGKSSEKTPSTSSSKPEKSEPAK